MLIENYFNVFKNSLFICLCFSNIFYWISLRLNHIKLIDFAGRITSRIAAISLSFFLLIRWFNYGYFPLSNLYESLLFLSCLLLFVQQILEYRTQSKFFGTLLLPIILFITTFADLTLPLEMQKASALVPALQSNWLMMHVSLMMLSYTVLLLGSLFSIIFLLLDFSFAEKSIVYNSTLYFTMKQDSEKKILNPEVLGSLGYITTKNMTKTIEEFLRTLDNWSYRAISLGFPLLTIGIISGAVWANEAWGSYWSWDPKETWALITWLVFAAYLHVRFIKGWAGKGPAILAALGFLVVWICYLGVNFLGQGLHSYGWLS